jgi:hypothetical protein
MNNKRKMKKKINKIINNTPVLRKFILLQWTDKQAKVDFRYTCAEYFLSSLCFVFFFKSYNTCFCKVSEVFNFDEDHFTKLIVGLIFVVCYLKQGLALEPRLTLRSKLTYFSLPSSGITGVRKTSHIAHKGGSREVSHVQKFNKQAGWPRKNGTAAFLSRSGLK